MNDNRFIITDQKFLKSSDVKDKSLCFDLLVKENETSEAVDKAIKSNLKKDLNEYVLVDDSFSDLSTSDVGNTDSSNALTNIRTILFSVNKNNNFKKLVENKQFI